VLVDATTGAIRGKWDAVHTTAAVGSGKSLYSGQVSIYTDSALLGGYALRDTTRGKAPGSGEPEALEEWRRRESKPLRAEPPPLVTRDTSPIFPLKMGRPSVRASPDASVRFGSFLVPMGPSLCWSSKPSSAETTHEVSWCLRFGRQAPSIPAPSSGDGGGPTEREPLPGRDGGGAEEAEEGAGGWGRAAAQDVRTGRASPVRGVEAGERCWRRSFSAPPLLPSPSTWLLSRLYAPSLAPPSQLPQAAGSPLAASAPHSLEGTMLRAVACWPPASSPPADAELHDGLVDVGREDVHRTPVAPIVSQSWL
jgi:hypothetical protein